MALLDLQGMESPAPSDGGGHGSSASAHSCNGSDASLLLCGETSEASLALCGH
jgi:SapB morphogen precursor RamS